MQVVLLGTGAADGIPQPFCRCDTCVDARRNNLVRTPTSVLIDGQILLDAPATVGSAAARAGVDLAAVHTIAVTHAHSDHWDPGLLLHHSWLFPDSPLRIIGPQSVINEARQWLPPNRGDELVPVTPGMRCDVGAHQVTVLPSTHGGDGHDVLANEAVLYAVEASDGTSLMYATDTGPASQHLLDAVAGARYDVVLAELTFGAHGPSTAGHLDHATFPQFLDQLRRVDATTDTTDVIAVHLSHHNPVLASLRDIVSRWGARVVPDGTQLTVGSTHPTEVVFITGGARSGKSHYAESAAAESGFQVRYVATGWPASADPSWAARVAAHQNRRPSDWTTEETFDLPGALASAADDEVLLIDCLSAWVTRLVDEEKLWDDPSSAHIQVTAATDALLDALNSTAARKVIVVSNEVGSGVVPATVSGGLFRDLLGRVNTAVATRSQRAVLLVSGRPLELTP